MELAASNLQDRAEVKMDTPYGPPSDVLITGTISGVPCVLLARHGRKCVVHLSLSRARSLALAHPVAMCDRAPTARLRWQGGVK